MMEKKENKQPELEQMRRQLEILTRKLDNEMDVHLRNIHVHMDKVDAEMWRNIRLPLIITPILVINLVNMHSSWWLYVMLLLIVVASVGYNRYLRRALNANDWYNQRNLIETRKRVIRTHRLYYRWYYVGIPYMTAWIALFCYDLSNHIDDVERMRYFWMGIAAGLVVGIPIGVYHFLRMDRHWNRLLADIEEYEREAGGEACPG